MMRTTAFLVTLLLFLSSSCFGQINWQSTEEVSKQFSSEQRPILIALKTDWCNVCKMQEQMVFNDSSIFNVLNSNFYCIQLDAENDTNLLFFGRKYAGANAHKYHELGTYLMGKQALVFPTLVLLDNRLNNVFRKEGFVSKNEFLKLIDEIKSNGK